ncbi:MAG TPA: cysteine desulfurase [Planctomycetes bacterium]|nr:cysteine desulfurase [Planctomycetota bacterium]
MAEASKIHYLDNAATTPVDPEVARFHGALLEECYGNPSSLHPLGIQAKKKLDEARDLLMGFCGASRMVFTGGGTEATNLALRGVLQNKPGARILAGEADHPSVLRTGEALEQQGYRFETYPVDQNGVPRLEALERLLDKEVRFVSILHGNNEVGSLAPLGKMVPLIRDKAPRAHIHVDAVQAFAKIPVDLDRLGVDSMTLAAHKIHGPKGVGALALGPKFPPQALITGGGQEGGLRSGTENVPGICAFAKAAELWISRQSEESGRIRAMRDRLEANILEGIPEMRRLGSQDRLPNILCLSLPGARGEVLMHHLEEEGICISTGSACSQRAEKRGKTGSHVLRAMGLDQRTIQGAIRISLGRLSTEKDLEAIEESLPRIVGKLKALGMA